jgi:glycerophosphoryl diester phosphodiesterase
MQNNQLPQINGFLFTTNKHTEKEIVDTLSFAIASKKEKYVGINLTMEVEDLYQKNFKPLKKDIRTWKDTTYSSIGRINFVKMSILPKATNPMQSQSKISILFLI